MSERIFMFEKKVNFRGHLIRPQKINNYTKFPSINFKEEFEYLKKLTEQERNISIAIVVERQLETIASGINLIPQLNKNIGENEIIRMESCVEVALESVGDQLHMILPLFYSYNLKTNKSDYLKDKKTRDICFNFYLRYLQKEKTNLEKVRQDFLDFQYHEYCAYPISKEFEIVKNTLDLDNVDNKSNILDKIFGLLIGLFWGGVFGPIGIIAHFLDTGSVQSVEEENVEKRRKPFQLLGVILANLTYLTIILYAINFT